jgi:hypothetical protein
MKSYFFIVSLLLANRAFAETDGQILAKNSQAIVYLQVEDSDGGILDRGTGFIVSKDGYVITAAHLKVEPTQTMWAVIGQRVGTRFPLAFREADEISDVAIWQFPQSGSPLSSVTISLESVVVTEHALALGFPGNEGLTPSHITIANVTSELGYYKSDGFLQPGNSGGPVFNDAGLVIAIVQGGTKPGTNNNDLVPIRLAISLLEKRGAVIKTVDPSIILRKFFTMYMGAPGYFKIVDNCCQVSYTWTFSKLGDCTLQYSEEIDEFHFDGKSNTHESYDFRINLAYLPPSAVRVETSEISDLYLQIVIKDPGQRAIVIRQTAPVRNTFRFEDSVKFTMNAGQEDQTIFLENFESLRRSCSGN